MHNNQLVAKWMEPHHLVCGMPCVGWLHTHQYHRPLHGSKHSTHVVSNLTPLAANYNLANGQFASSLCRKEIMLHTLYTIIYINVHDSLYNNYSL